MTPVLPLQAIGFWFSDLEPVEGVFDRIVVTREGSTQTKAGHTFWKGDHIRAPEGAGPTP